MTAYSTGASWSFPEDLPGEWVNVENEREPELSSDTIRAASPSTEYGKSPEKGSESPSRMPQNEPTTPTPNQEEQQNDAQPNEQHHRTHYSPRTCRICLEQVEPTFHTPEPSSLPTALQPPPRVTYESPPGDGGRLLRPCKCKGSQKHVHEECLSAWRLQNPLEKRNYWQCPTCGYKYKLQRLSYGKWISSTAAQVVLTVLIFVAAMFLLGFVADPIINLYLDPVGAIASMPDAVRDVKGKTASMVFEDEAAGWSEHFVKGLASLGVLGFAKFLLTLSPWHWFNMRGGGIYAGGGGWGGGWGTGGLGGLGGFGGGGGRNGRGVTGRDRLEQLSWITILIGIVTVVYAVWKGVRAWSRRTLEKAGERVMDVPGADNDDEDD